MASDRLFEMLAQAKSQPDRWSRDLNAGADAGKDIIGGYLQGRQIRTGMQEAALKPFEIWSKIAEQAGPDVANNIFKQRGIPVPDISGGQPQSNDPASLINEGSFGAKRLTSMKTAQDLQNNAPYSLPESNAMLSSNPDAAKALAQAYPNGNIPSRVIQNVIASASANRLSGLINLKGREAVKSYIPSLNPTSQGGLASAVQFASRQGKQLVADPNPDPQRLAAASLEFARTVMRAAPTLDAQNGANYSNTISNYFNQIGQRLSNGQYKPEDIPAIRQTMFKNFDDLENSSKPIIARQLNEGRSQFPEYADWDSLTRQEMGSDLPPIQFQMSAPAPVTSSGSVQNPGTSTGVPGQGNGWAYVGPAKQ